MSMISMDRISSLVMQGLATGMRTGCGRTLAMIALLGAVSTVGACSAPRTWPSMSGSPGISADTPPLPQVVISALNYAHTEVSKDSPLIYNLPEEINPAAFGTFQRGLAPGKAMCPGDTHVWTVRQARIDGSKAQVDIEYPSRDGFYQTLTVHLQGATGGFDYKPAFIQYWKVPVKDPVCQQPLSIVERLCGSAAAEKLRSQREAAGVAAGVTSAGTSASAAKSTGNTPPKAAPVSATEEPTK